MKDYLITLALIPVLGCIEPLSDEGSGSIGEESSTEEGDGDGDPGDGDGDGDGDPGDGDGDLGDGDGDGDLDPGDGDGDGDLGDGDGDPGDGDRGDGSCPSNGAGGVIGEASIAAAAYPDVPGVILVPSGYEENAPLPLLLALHGSGGTAGGFVDTWSELAESENFIVLAPESHSGGNSWWPGDDTSMIYALIEQAKLDWNIDECRIYVAGHSAGAHYSYDIGLESATYFAGIGALAGTLQYAQDTGVWPNAVERKIAVSIHHGINDGVVPLSHAEYSRDQLEAADHPVYYDTHDGWHEIGPGDPAQMWANLSTHTNAL